MKTILFVSHKKAQCGVYEFGKSVMEVLVKSVQFNFVHVECSSLIELNERISEHRPDAIIYNYHPSVLPWITTKVIPAVLRNNISRIKIPQIGILHEVTQSIADTATSYRKQFYTGERFNLGNSLFDFYIAPDPTLLLSNPVVYKTGRLIPSYENRFTSPARVTIGSFGFGTPEKGFEKIVNLVQDEFDDALIRFNIPYADFGDKSGENARAIAKRCKDLINKKGIELLVTHDFHDEQKMLDFLAQNTVNVFLYESKHGRGLSSTVDKAMAVQRPIAVSNSSMFRHLFDAQPSVSITNNSLKTIISNGFEPLRKYYDEWNAVQLLWEYERILHSAFDKTRVKQKPGTSLTGTIKTQLRRALQLPGKSSTWLRNTQTANEDNMERLDGVAYQPVEQPGGVLFNRILDNAARMLYKPAIELLMKYLPETMSKKIAEANVQQGFVFDTVYRNLGSYRHPKLLCVGSYEDTAAMMLRRLGCDVDEIDPVINYYLQEFYTKPSTKKASYHIIFSTSVIEHDPDDESFIKCVEGLLAINGLAVITCDYKDGWKKGDPKPEVDARFYTRPDLEKRLISYLPTCELIDEPQWDCPNPDFNYLGKYQYTFATFVFRKVR